MAAKAGRVVIATVACLLWLNGCETSTKLGDLFQGKTDTKTDTNTDAKADSTASLA